MTTMFCSCHQETIADYAEDMCYIPVPVPYSITSYKMCPGVFWVSIFYKEPWYIVPPGLKVILMSSLFVFYVRVRLLHKNYTVILPEIHIIIPGGDDVGLLEGGGLLPDERVLDGLHRHAGGLPPGLQVLTRTYTTGAGYSIRKTAGQIPKKG